MDSEPLILVLAFRKNNGKSQISRSLNPSNLQYSSRHTVTGKSHQGSLSVLAELILFRTLRNILPRFECPRLSPNQLNSRKFVLHASLETQTDIAKNDMMGFLVNRANRESTGGRIESDRLNWRSFKSGKCRNRSNLRYRIFASITVLL